jgi:UPF0042 nucleotide-binding protein
MMAPVTSTPSPTIELVLITGMSGSGKSIALNALEDVGFYCVDNLPPELLEPFLALEQSHRANKVAIAMDVRSASSLPSLPQRLALLQNSPTRKVQLTILFLDASTDPLVFQYINERPDGPVRFHYPAVPLAEDFGVATPAGASIRGS